MNKPDKGWGHFAPIPVFDLGLYLFSFIAPIFFWLPWNLNMVQSLFFVLGVFFLLGLSFLCPRKREFNQPLLAFIILWSLISIFLHNFKLYGDSFYAKFIAFSTMSEGFIYVLCGALLYYLIVSYKNKFDIFYPLFFIGLLNLFFAITQSLGLRLIWTNVPTICGMMGTSSQLSVFSALSIPILSKRKYILGIIPLITLYLSKSYTGLFAFYFVYLLYFLRPNWINKDFQTITIWFWLIIGLAFVLWKHQILWGRLQVRFETWSIALKEILKSPLLGWGFDKTIANNMINSKMAGGWTYRHNDYFNIAKDLGIPFLAFIIIFIKKILKNTQLNYLTLSILILLTACFFQTNFYFSRIAIVGIILLALKQREKLDAKI